MTTGIENTQAVPGANISDDQIHMPEGVEHFLELLGLHLSRGVALIIVAAGLFFIGAAIASALAGSERRKCILLSSPISFLVSSIVWLPMLNWKFLSVGIAPIDAFSRWQHGNNPTLATILAMACVMVLGTASCVVLNSVSASATWLVEFLQRSLQNGIGGGKAPPAGS